MSALAFGPRRATVAAINPYQVHGAPFFHILCSPADAPETMIEARLGSEAVTPGLAVGDAVRVHSLLNNVIKVEKVDA